MTQMKLFERPSPSGGITLRYYQEEMCDAVEEAWAGGLERLLAVLPTGAGKTAAAGAIIKPFVERGQRVLVMAHTRKLVKQFAEAIGTQHGIEGGIEMGNVSHGGEHVVLATIQSMANRIKKKAFPRDYFDLVVIDEAHRILSPSYKRATNYFDSLVLGITATPRRTDQKCLMDFFDEKVYDIPLNRIISEGFLSRIVIRNFPLDIDISNVSSKGGDYDLGEVGHAIEPYLAECAAELAKYKGRRMLVFLPLISTSKMFEAECAKLGLRVRHVDGTSPEGRVDEIAERLRKGNIDGICNSMLLTEGVDLPSVDLIMNLRPTKSWNLYTQIIGRGTRVSPGKGECIVLDPLWLCDDHSLLQRPANLIARSDEEAEAITKKLKDGGDLMEATSSVAADREESLRERLERNRQRKSREMDAMEFFLSIGDIDLAEYAPMAKWEEGNITEGQARVLVNMGIDMDTVKDKGHASKIIDALFTRRSGGLGTLKQVKYAQSLGMEDAWSATFKQLSEYIGTHKK